VYVYYDASGENDDDWYKSNFIPYVRAVDIIEPQFVGVAPMAGGAYSFGDEVYVSLIFDEIIGGVGSASELTINTNLSNNPFVFAEGLGTNVLVFKGVVDKEDDEFDSVIISSINNSDSISDLAAYAGTHTGGGGGSTGIDANTIRPTVSFTGSSSDTLPRHSVQVGIGSAVSAKYVWTQSTAMPVTGWTDLPALTGGTLSESLSSGTWYLHVLAVHENGNSRWENIPLVFQQPTMNVSVDNSNWAQSRNITLSLISAVPVSVDMSGPKNDTYTAGQSITVTANGTYTFTLTDSYGSSIVKYADVSRIDRTAPVISISEYGDTDLKYTVLDFGASASDESGGSGISTLQYAWTSSEITPESDWTGMSIGDDIIPEYTIPGPVYLHVKAVDKAGNIAYSRTEEYTVMNDEPPSIIVTGGGLSGWQGTDVILYYTVTIPEGGAAITSIFAADDVIKDGLPSSGTYNGSVSVGENGLYTFIVIDEDGLSDSENVVINYIDKQAPVVSFSYETGQTISSWATSKIITVNAGDNASPIVDENGIITGYGGSGTASVEIKEGAEGTYYTIDNGGSFTLEEDTTCYIKVTDAVGNSTVYTLPVSGIDRVAPVVSITTTALWQKTPYNAVATYSDSYSGIASARYAVTGNNTDIPEVLSDMPESGGSITVSGNGSRYIYYEIADNAGNTARGWSGEVKIDTVAPELTVSANKDTSEGEAYTSGEWTKEDVVFTLGNEAAQLSGTGYKVSKDGGEYETVTGSAYTVSSDTDATYSFKAVSGSGTESSAVEYTVRIDKSGPSIEVTGNPTAWQNTGALLNLAVSEPGISGQTVT
ncbi:MAG TPA: hypothetical protein VN580_12845, partial [Clostridia bacterium]|nr:hypothetical protein [Clostridia bacterium]